MHHWALKWRQENRLDGKTEHIIRHHHGAYNYPTFLVFHTRREAREHLKANYGYLRTRPDLKAEPHGWKMPQVVKVVVSIKEVIG